MTSSQPGGEGHRCSECLTKRHPSVSGAQTLVYDPPCVVFSDIITIPIMRSSLWVNNDNGRIFFFSKIVFSYLGVRASEHELGVAEGDGEAGSL